MQVIDITNKELLNNFLVNQKHSQFLQSWEWRESQETAGLGQCPVRRLVVEDNGNLVAVATIIKKLLPMGKSYFYCPRGPVTNFQFSISNFQSISNDLIFKYNRIIKILFEEIEKIIGKENAIFLRLEPQFTIQNSQFKIHRTIDIQPSKTLILDLNKSEEELLGNMHQKTRYNIRLAEKKGVKIKESGKERFREFWQIMKETEKRDGFRLHDRNYYKRMLKHSKHELKLGRKNEFGIRLFLAEYKGKMIAVNIVSFFGDTATYMHGASSNEYRNMMATYLLQWHAIKLAKKLGYKYYDFYGIDEIKWLGVTRFKKGFGGKIFEYPGTFDLVFNKKWYIIYKVSRRLRRMI